jgi:hypothetical protein
MDDDQYDVARAKAYERATDKAHELEALPRLSCAPLSWTSTNFARRPQTNAH